MRRSVITTASLCSLLLSPVLAAGSAMAGVDIAVKTKTYSVSGKTGADLIKAMDRKGPRHGFMARAIAQTSYTVGWEFQWANTGGTCRLADAQGALAMTYTFPKAAGKMSAPLQARWTAFMAGVQEHEEQHGAIAREMVASAERSVRGLTMRNDRECNRAQAEVKKRISAIYAKYEARQIKFDKVEHREGGNVYRLLLDLTGRR